MKNLSLIFLLLVAFSKADGVWLDMFGFPWLNVPLQLMFGISCPVQNQCWITGGNSNTAFGVYRTGNDNFTRITKLNISSPEPAIFLLSIDMQDATHGITGGVEIGVGGTYYTTDGTTFKNSLEIGIVDTQAVYSIGNDQYGFVGQYNKNQGPAYSSDGGQSFKGEWWGKDFSVNAPPRYGAFINESVIYVTGGQWPQQNQTRDEIVEITSQLRFNKNTQEYEFKDFEAIENTDPSGYTAVIAKSVDGGATWKVQYNSTGEFYFNAISCASATHCFAVGEGFAQDGGKPGAHVFQTNDGENWRNVFTWHNTTGGSGLDVQMLSETDIWIGTADQVGASPIHSTDGGKTWHESPVIKKVGVITQMSISEDGTWGYAAAVTTLQISTLLRLSNGNEAYEIPKLDFLQDH